MGMDDVALKDILKEMVDIVYSNNDDTEFSNLVATAQSQHNGQITQERLEEYRGLIKATRLPALTSGHEDVNETATASLDLLKYIWKMLKGLKIKRCGWLQRNYLKFLKQLDNYFYSIIKLKAVHLIFINALL
jgi:hypothetical protein